MLFVEAGCPSRDEVADDLPEVDTASFGHDLLGEDVELWALGVGIPLSTGN